MSNNSSDNKRVVRFHPNVDKDKVKKMKESFSHDHNNKGVKKTSKKK